MSFKNVNNLKAWAPATAKSAVLDLRGQSTHLLNGEVFKLNKHPVPIIF